MGSLIRQPKIVETERLPEKVAAPVSEQKEVVENVSVETTSIEVEPTVSTPSITPEQIEEAFTQARQEGLKEGKEEGLTLGHKEGLQKGEQAALEAWKGKLEQLNGLLASFTEARKDAIERVDDEFVPVVFSALTKIVGDLALSPDFVRAVVHQALQSVRSKEQITIKVHPDDVDLLATDELLLVQQDRITILADATINAGCVIETSCGNVDAELETLMSSLKTVLAEVRVG
jgi:flagellar assembly protein FliH